MNIFMLPVSISGIIVLFAISAWGKRKGYFKKGHENFWFDKIMHFFAGFFVAIF